jgi:t-SNARE complex subunit, syntaxin
MSNKDDKELLELLTKLYGIQETIGAKPKTSLEDKRHRAENTASMGRGKKAKKTGGRFVDLKSSIINRLKTIHSLLEEEQQRIRMGMSVASGNNPKEVIAKQAQIREEIRQVEDEWQELDGIYKNEARKRKSKFSKEELDVQQTLVQRLYSELEKVKQLSSKNYARGNGATREDIAAGLNAKALNVMDVSDFDGKAASWAGSGPSGGGGGGGVELTHQQHLKLQQIDSRDQDFDRQLDDIGQGIQDLAEIAQMQNEEVRRQNIMLENVESKIDDAHDHITNINSKMKETLDEVRGADKVCVDIMCIVLMVGLGAVLYKLIQKNGF